MHRLILVLLAAALLAACGPQPARRVQPARVTDVMVEVRESSPVQVVAHIQGELGDGCTSLGTITQSRDGNVIEVSVPAVHSGAEVCTMILQLVDERVQLDGPFPPGDYTVRVNGVEHQFSI